MNEKLKKILIISPYVIVFFITMFLYTHRNNFPFFYHTTEPSKIEQITVHNYNFNHPLLMLDTAGLAAKISGAQTQQEKVMAGRTVSAVYASLTIVLLMICAHLLSGPFAAAAAGFLMSFSPMMIRLSHYFKEDPTFLFGIALSLLAFIIFFRKPSVKTLAFAAVSAAAASSGKYVGFIFLVMGIVAIVRTSVYDAKQDPLSRKKKVGLFLLIFFAVFTIINIDMILYFNTIIERLSAKLSHTGGDKAGGIVALSGHGGARPAFPLFEYIKMFFRSSSGIIPYLVLGYFAHLIATFKKREAGEKFITAFFFLFTIILSFGKVASDQYFLPQELLCFLFSAIIVYRISVYVRKWIGTRISIACFAAAIAVLIFSLYPFAADAVAQFDPKYDSRVKMTKWIEASIDAPAKIACDGYVLLPDMISRSSVLSARKGLSCELMEYTGDLGSVEAALKKGFTHVAVANSTYGRFFDKNNVPSAGAAGLFAARQSFYAELFLKGSLVWETKSRYGGIINETLKIYRLPSSGIRNTGK
jgi:hypothetical protein